MVYLDLLVLWHCQSYECLNNSVCFRRNSMSTFVLLNIYIVPKTHPTMLRIGTSAPLLVLILALTLLPSFIAAQFGNFFQGFQGQHAHQHQQQQQQQQQQSGHRGWNAMTEGTVVCLVGWRRVSGGAGVPGCSGAVVQECKRRAER
jgi:hypothetical protein